jgi:hypothetical protein
MGRSFESRNSQRPMTVVVKLGSGHDECLWAERCAERGCVQRQPMEYQRNSDIEVEHLEATYSESVKGYIDTATKKYLIAGF